MGLTKHRFVGLDRDVWLPDDIMVTIDIVPASRRNIRSHQRNAPNYSTWHDTGNPGATAMHERNYLHGGAGGNYVGYNFAVDDTRIIQLTPLDEITWAAGTPDGNRTSWHVEQCFGGSIDFDRSTRNCAALHGALIAAMPGWVLEPSLVQHNVWYGKHCPAQLRNRGLWPKAVKLAKQFHAGALAAAAGKDAGEAADDAADGWPYPDPVPPPFWDALMTGTHAKAGDTLWYRIDSLYRVKTGTARLQYAIGNGATVGPELTPGTTFRAAAIGQSGMDGRTYVITPMHTRVALEDLEYVAEELDAA